jgi:hypothetical protein
MNLIKVSFTCTVYVWPSDSIHLLPNTLMSRSKIYGVTFFVDTFKIFDVPSMNNCCTREGWARKIYDIESNPKKLLTNVFSAIVSTKVLPLLTLTRKQYIVHVEKPAETQTSIRLASHLGRAHNFLNLTFRTQTFLDCLLWFTFSFWGWVMGRPGRKNEVNASVVRWELIADTPFSFLADTVQTRLQHSRNVCGKAALKQSCRGCFHKVLTYIEYRAVSGVFRTIDPPPPLHPASVSSPRTKGGGEGGGTHSPDGEAVRVNSSEDARH